MKWIASLIGLILLLSWSLYPVQHHSKIDHLSEIREWALANALWPKLTDSKSSPLIAVRQIYEIKQSQLHLKAYLLAPCQSLCGLHESCARHCQSLVLEWNGKSPDARLVVDGYDLKEQRSLGRVTLSQVAPIELRYWSRKQRLMALIQEHSPENKVLQLIKLASSTPKSQKKKTQHTDHLVLYDQLSLGPYHGRESPLRGSVSLRDLDGDEIVEVIAPLQRLVQLHPTPLFVPTPYRLTHEGLKIAPKLINVTAPSNSQLRQWLLSMKGNQTSEVLHIEQLERLFSFSLLLCLKGQCRRADDLVHYAYPQHSSVLQLWSQLKATLEAPMIKPDVADLIKDPFSVLNP